MFTKQVVGLILVCLFLLTPAAAQDMQVEVSLYYTYHQADGNRLVDGQGAFPNVQTLDFPLLAAPAWVVGTLLNDTPVWIVVTEVGQILGVTPVGETLETITVMPEVMEGFVPTPPLGVVWDNDVFAFTSLGVGSTNPTHAISADGNHDSYLVIDDTGDVALLTSDFSEADRVALNALRDGRMVMNEAGQVAVYAEETQQRYVHGALGDLLEAAALVVLEVEDNELQVVSRIDLPGLDVFEGISPFWADVDEDGVDDLVTTVSNGEMGAQIQVYGVEGNLIATGPAIGRGGRWRHQLAFGAFGPNGENELVDVLTPHIGGVVEFYRYEDGALNIVAQQGGYTSHVLGTRNLDMVVGGDFNGDGQLEIVLPDQLRTRIVGLQHMENGVEEVWSLPLNGGRLVTNLAATVLPNGKLALAAGTDGGRLHVWMSEF
jgi:hypothetical protein